MDPDRAIATSPAVGVFRPGVAIGSAVHAGDRIAIVDLLGIPQDVTSPIDGTLVELFVQAGAKLVAVQDHTGTLANPNGFDMADTMEVLKRDGGIANYKKANA